MVFVTDTNGVTFFALPVDLPRFLQKPNLRNLSHFLVILGRFIVKVVKVSCGYVQVKGPTENEILGARE